MEKTKVILDVHERPKSPALWLALSLQHLLAMFGATVTVPLLIGINPSIALITGGLGTLLFLALTKGKVPEYVSSSFAFIGPIIAFDKLYGIETALFSAGASGLVYIIVAGFIKKFGSGWLLKLLPPYITGPVMVVIGLGLAHVAVSEAFTKDGIFDLKMFAVAAVTIILAGVFALKLKRPFSLFPFLLAVLVGYILSIILGMVDFSVIGKAAYFAIPKLSFPHAENIKLVAILSIVPVSLVTISEHIGHQLVLQSITGKDYFKDPGLHMTLLGDGLASLLAGFIGGPPNTTYGENLAVLAVTRVFSIYVIAGAAVIAILLGFVGKVSGFLQSIPLAVIGGFSIILFGVIASAGIKTMVDAKIDINNTRHLIIVSVVLVLGLGGVPLDFGSFQLDNMALAVLGGIVLDTLIPGKEKSMPKSSTDEEEAPKVDTKEVEDPKIDEPQPEKA